jgi:DNA-binding beta-propeller fold protein YncE
MNREQVLAVAVIGLVFGATRGVVLAQSQQNIQVPKFRYDPTFPQPLPEKWAIGAIGGMAVDSHDHIWVLHRPGPLQKNERFAGAAMTPPRADCCIPAPPVLEFDQDGKLLAAWGGPGQGYEWPSTEHGIFVDAKDNVWLAGSGDKDDQVLKFTTAGKFLAQFGHQGKSGGSSDTQNLGGPANLTVDSANDELYIADGYRNRRVIVIDTETLTVKRMWGAYGNKPEDKDLGPYNPDAPPAQQFRLPHNVALSKDGFVYVADRVNDRIQVFRKAGTFVREGFVAPRTLLAGSASGLAFSPDQRFLYVIDGANHHVWILLRETLQVLDHIGQQGTAPTHIEWLASPGSVLGAHTGGLRRCHAVACSYALASAKTVTSANGAPQICRPIGRPAPVNPQGTVIAGSPKISKGAVFRKSAFELSAIRTGETGIVGVTNRSTLKNVFLISRRSNSS